MKNQKGITLTSLIIYIVLIFFIIVILARVSVYFTSNMSEISKDSASISEIDKFNMYFLKDTKRTGNKIESVSEDGTSITFTNGTTYSFSKDNEVIYYENVADDKKIIIAETIEDCKFIQSKENSKDIVNIEITINEKVHKYEYVMGYENAYKTHETESSYIAVEELEGFAITTNTDGVVFTKSDGITPGDPYNLKNGDIVIYGDYKYTYSGGGWSVAVTDKTKEEYGEIAVAVYGKTITSLKNTFSFCTNLISSPEIPNTVNNMQLTYEACKSLKEAAELPEKLTGMNHTFYGCSSLKVAPEIPETVTSMTSTFYGCSSLIEPPKIPSGVTNMGSAFRGCTSLKTAPEIPNGVKNLNQAFQDCKSLIETPEIPVSVTSMNIAFGYCTSLEIVSEIPESVTSMNSTFYSCPNLQGEIIINATPTTYTSCFQNAGTQGTGIILKGSSTVLNELAATNTQGKVTVGN